MRFAYLEITLEVDDGGFLVAVHSWLDVQFSDTAPLRISISVRVQHYHERVGLN